ncbi:MAG: protein-disulfide reductase DsbD [Acidiferrobacterales bacterium]
MKRSALALTTLLLTLRCDASHTGASQPELLEPDQAFRLSARVINGHMLEARWQIATGYYMYRHRFDFVPIDRSITIGTPIIPSGKTKQDAFFGAVEIYKHDVAVRLPIIRHNKDPHRTTLRISAQGCNEPIGVCYPPIIKQVNLDLPAVTDVVGSAATAQLVPAQTLRELLAGSSNEREFLHPDQAFVLTIAPTDARTLHARFVIAEGYYLYRDKVRFALGETTDSGKRQARLGAYVLPPGKPKVDEYFGETTVYYQGIDVALPLHYEEPPPATLLVNATYQGCAEKGICYPPITKRFEVQVDRTGVAAVRPLDGATTQASAMPAEVLGTTATGTVATRDRSSLVLAMVGAFGAGLLLTFTPCVLPMIPIVSSVIIGRAGKDVATLRGGLLSFTYVLGTVVTYTAVGIIAGATGDQLQAYFQNAWAIGLLAAVFVAMALAMFGVYELRMPSFIQSHVHERIESVSTHSLGGVFVLGLGSALIVGACVSPLLISVLGVAIASQDPVLGGVVMFSMAMGMGVILIAVGLGASYLLPKAGPWMNQVKHVFGVLVLAVAIYLLGFIPQVPVLLLWGALFIVVGVYLGATQNLPAGASGWRYLWKAVGTFLLIWGVLALIGGFAGHRDPLRPLPISLLAAGTGAAPGAALRSAPTAESQRLFERVTARAALEDRLRAARVAGRPVLVDYYADWCTDCVRMERLTFSDPRVREALVGRFVLLQLDVTDTFDPESRALKQRFGVYGPPATLFLSTSGKERHDLRFYGFRSPDEFLQILRKADALSITALR